MKKHRFPKPFPVMLSAVLCLAGVPFGGISAQAADSVQQVNNSVCLHSSPPADTDNFMADKTEDMVAMCNSTDTYRSLAKYMDTISYGKVHVTSYFPQMQDGVIQPHVLKQEKVWLYRLQPVCPGNGTEYHRFCGHAPGRKPRRCDRQRDFSGGWSGRGYERSALGKRRFMSTVWN